MNTTKKTKSSEDDDLDLYVYPIIVLSIPQALTQSQIEPAK